MKLFVSIFLIGSLSFAQDMSRTEDRNKVYKNLPNGEVVYIGGCSTYEDYENKKFKVVKLLVEYFEPDSSSPSEYNLKMKSIDRKLIQTAANLILPEFNGSLVNADSIRIEKIESLVFKNLDLYRLDIGVGGGNGYIIVYNKVGSNYELMSYSFDYTLEYCDKKVWTKK